MYSLLSIGLFQLKSIHPYGRYNLSLHTMGEDFKWSHPMYGLQSIWLFQLKSTDPYGRHNLCLLHKGWGFQMESGAIPVEIIHPYEYQNIR